MTTTSATGPTGPAGPGGPVGPTGPTADPLFDALRRRHPDVDLVLAPPDPPPPLPDQQVDDAVVSLALRATTALASALWVAVVPSPTAAHEPVGGLDPVAPGRVRPVAVGQARRADGADVLGALHQELERRGFAVRRPPGGLPRLVARRGDVEVGATWSTVSGALEMRVHGATLPVGLDRARRCGRTPGPEVGGGRR